MRLRSTAALAFAFGALALAAPVGTASAAPSACPGHFQNGAAPDLVKESLAAKTRELCYLAYATLHSGVSRTPLWSAEHLTADSLQAAEALTRPSASAFHADPNVPAVERATLKDYKGTGFDRGHMAPNGDMPTEDAQQESFSLANMVPQAPKLNRKLWEAIESAVRIYAVTEGQLYVVTGPIFQGANLRRIGGRVLVPTQIFKAVYDPKQQQAGAYLVNNTDDSDYQSVSIAELERLAGIAMFPGLPDAVRTTAMTLPTPKPHGTR